MWRPTVILYCGDHDPSGLDMDRDIAERLAARGLSNLLRRRLAFSASDFGARFAFAARSCRRDFPPLAGVTSSP